MIFKRETNKEYFTRIKQWHKWFAWYPVAFDGGIAWLSYVECIYDQGYCNSWTYREIPKEEVFKKKFKDEVK